MEMSTFESQISQGLLADVGENPFMPVSPLEPPRLSFLSSLEIGQEIQSSALALEESSNLEKVEDSSLIGLVEGEPLVGDVDFDGDVDRDDVGIIFAARNTPASGSDDLLDIDGDGTITVLDGRQVAVTIATNTDNTAPEISATLTNDTAPGGTTNTDGITSDSTIGGIVGDDNLVTRLWAGFDSTPPENFINITGTLQIDGTFQLTPADLETINGSPLSEGGHTLYLQAKDQWANLSGLVEVNFTLDTTAPELDITNPLDGAQISQGTRLIGTADGTGSDVASLNYQFDSLSEIPVAVDPTGDFDVELDLTGVSQGLQTLAVTTEDLAGNATMTDLNVELVTVTGELDEAVDLGTLVAPITLSEFVGDSDPIDLYRFSLDTDSEFFLNLDGLSADADVDLIQDFNNNKTIDENEFLNFSLQRGTDAENINSPLAEGTYYIRIRQVEGNTDYNLNLSAVAVEGIAIEELAKKEENSLGEVSIVGISETVFNSLSSNVTFNISGATFSTNPEDILLFNNNQIVPNNLIDLSADATSISVSSLLSDGPNEIDLYAVDDQGIRLFKETTVWAGSNTLNVIAVDENSQPIDGAVVSAKLTEDQSVLAQATTSSNGQVSFLNIPNRTISLEALAGDNLFSSFGAFGSDGNVVLTLKGFDEPSPIDNNDFSLGTEGWNIGDAPVSLIPHQEPVSTVQSLSLASVNQIFLQDLSSREISSDAHRPDIEVQQTEITPSLSTLTQANQSNDNIDLVLNTLGEGEQSISRTFTIQPDTQSVTVRYQFITSEIPGGFFGTQFNDYFRVSIRSLQGGGNASEANSMNGLGLGAFDAGGATAFREVTLPTSEQGDTVQVEIAVANVADGLFDSQVVVDLVEESNLAITQLALNDIDNTALQFLSVDGNNPYFGGNTRIHGEITIEGDEDDSLNSLELQIVQGGAVVATGNLDNAVQGTLLNQPFGDDETLEINTSQLLFNLPNAQAANINVAQDGTVNLRVKATSSNGGEVIQEFGAVTLLGRYTDNNRYGGRDGNVGGDDWALPSVIDIIEHFGNQITLGDFSNMNGGQFAPHQTHRDGTHVDGWFNGYNARNAATAQTMINLLNDPTHGSNIQTVYVTFQQVNTDAFWNAIQNVVLNDGRMARDVIRPVGGHTTHFHWIINP